MPRHRGGVTVRLEVPLRAAGKHKGREKGKRKKGKGEPKSAAPSAGAARLHFFLLPFYFFLGLQIAQPRLPVRALVFGEPAARKIKRDVQRGPGGIDESQSVPVARRG